MADVVGVDHVSAPTDQHVTPGSVSDYTQWMRPIAASCAAPRLRP
jgi:hypothetical protein